MTSSMVLYTVHVTCQDIDGGATEADGGASAPVGPSVATPLSVLIKSTLAIPIPSNGIDPILIQIPEMVQPY